MVVGDRGLLRVLGADVRLDRVELGLERVQVAAARDRAVRDVDLVPERVQDRQRDLDLALAHVLDPDPWAGEQAPPVREPAGEVDQPRADAVAQVEVLGDARDAADARPLAGHDVHRVVRVQVDDHGPDSRPYPAGRIPSTSAAGSGPSRCDALVGLELGEVRVGVVEVDLLRAAIIRLLTPRG